MAEGVITVYLENVTNEGVVCPRSDVVVGKGKVWGSVWRHGGYGSDNKGLFEIMQAFDDR